MSAELETNIAKLEEEKRIMLQCADLNPREDGNSIYMQIAIRCQKDIDTLTRINS